MQFEDFAKVIGEGHIYRSLFHFTDKSNLESISQYGLLSKEEAARKGITVPTPGGNEWSHDADQHKGLNDYVNLCFTTSHPMCHLAHLDGRIPHPFYIPVAPEVLLLDGVRVTLGVANKADTELLEMEDGLAALDKEVLYTRTEWADPDIQNRLRNAEKCEVLVPTRVPKKYLGI